MNAPNPFVTQEQERLRALVDTMWKEEYPLRSEDLKTLGPFVKQVREEITQDDTPGRRAIRRVGYFMLNARGRQLYKQWLTGGLDRLA